MKDFLGVALAAALVFAPVLAFAPSSAMAQQSAGHVVHGGSQLCSAGLADARGPATPATLKIIETETKAIIDIIPQCALSDLNPRLHLRDLGGALVKNPHLLSELHARGIVVQRVVAAGMVGKTLHLFVEGPNHPAANEEQHERGAQ